MASNRSKAAILPRAMVDKLADMIIEEHKLFHKMMAEAELHRDQPNVCHERWTRHIFRQQRKMDKLFPEHILVKPTKKG